MNHSIKLKRVLELQAEIELRKALYDELDKLTLELLEDGFRDATLDGITLELVDNFAAGKNTVFRPAGVKRFEIKVKKVKGA